MSEQPVVHEVPFATLQDLADRGRPTTLGDEMRVMSLVRDASQMLIDEMPAAVTRAHPDTLTRIVCAMVGRVLDSGAADSMTGVESTQFGVGPFQQSYKWANPSGDLYVSKAERRALGGPRRASSVSMMPEGAGREYPGPWVEVL